MSESAAVLRAMFHTMVDSIRGVDATAIIDAIVADAIVAHDAEKLGWEEAGPTDDDTTENRAATPQSLTLGERDELIREGQRRMLQWLNINGLIESENVVKAGRDWGIQLHLQPGDNIPLVGGGSVAMQSEDELYQPGPLTREALDEGAKLAQAKIVAAWLHKHPDKTPADAAEHFALDL
jgi:hypothetical protein